MPTEKRKTTLAEKIDFFFNKLLPKKIIVITIATIIVFKQLEAPQEFWFILMGYFSVNIAGKFADVMKSKNTDT